jgi:hypothetical protein
MPQWIKERDSRSVDPKEIYKSLKIRSVPDLQSRVAARICHHAATGEFTGIDFAGKFGGERGIRTGFRPQVESASYGFRK